jgi:DNA-binding transcriptional regulator YbjK
MSSSGPTKRRRRDDGERARIRLLDATISVIAQKGIGAVSHRAVAIEAGLAPALTTYYFAGKADMISASFDRFVFRGLETISRSWESAFEVLDRYSAKHISHESTLAQLTELTATYIFDDRLHQTDGVAFELAFLFNVHLDDDLRQKVRKYREDMRSTAHTFCAKAGSIDPDADAALLTGLISRLEFERLADEVSLSPKSVKAQIGRLLGVILSE